MMRIALLVTLALVACKRGDRAFVPDPTAVPRVLLHEDGVENAYPRLSSDGREVLYQSNRTGKWQIRILELATGIARTLTSEGNNNLPDWSPDDRRIAFVSDRDGNEEIYTMNHDGTGQRRWTFGPGRDIHPYFSPDGTSLLYNAQQGTGSFDVFSLELATGVARQLTDTPQDETCARASPDGAMVFLRNDPHGDDIWLRDAGGAERNLTNTPAVRDGWPTFSPDGSAIYYAAMEAGSFSLYRMRADGTQVERLSTAAANEEDARPFVSRDGKRLVFNRRHPGSIDIVELRI